MKLGGLRKTLTDDHRTAGGFSRLDDMEGVVISLNTKDYHKRVKKYLVYIYIYVCEYFFFT